MRRFRPPSRNQIRSIVGENNPEIIRRFELLFQQAGQDTPDVIEGGEESAAAFEATMRAIVDELSTRITSEMVAPAHIPPADQSNKTVEEGKNETRLQDIADVKVRQYENNSSLVYNSERREWVSFKLTLKEVTENLSPIDGQALVYDAVTKDWVLKSLKLEDVTVNLSPVDGQGLIYNAANQSWQVANIGTSGFTGSFNSLDGSTVNVSNGLITSVNSMI